MCREGGQVERAGRRRRGREGKEEASSSFPSLPSHHLPSQPPNHVQSRSRIDSGKCFPTHLFISYRFYDLLRPRSSTLTFLFSSLPSLSLLPPPPPPSFLLPQALIIGAGKAAPTPPIGPALGARGVKSMDFCKEFNARTNDFIAGTPLRTTINIAADKTFTFDVQSPTSTWFLLKAAGIEKGHGEAGTKGFKPVGKVGLKTIYEIAKIKSTDTNLLGQPLYGVCSALVASAGSLGIEVVY
ncbi:ribosomal protein L11, N-terminal domain-containing protein [Mrakia frigida]|uniref:mitochondrial 54S ribosomal protein uL11m MRPL19 n=1 Tax=Mrakia frigida TaxID=29902 RepID=UPI003FCC04AB